MRRRLGIDSKVYFNSNWNQAAGTGYNAPTWVEMKRFEDVTLSMNWTTAPAGDRGQGVTASAKTRVNCNATGRLRVDDDDAGYQVFLAAALSRDAELDLMILNGSQSSNGATGVRGLFQINRFDENQGADQVLYRDTSMDIAPVDDAFPVQSVVVASTVPVYTTAFAPPA